MNKKISQQEKTWAALAHVSVFLGLMIPLGGVIGPLVIWLVKRHELPFVDLQAKEVINFRISYAIYTLILIILSFLLIGLPFLAVLLLLQLIFIIRGSIKASKGESYHYPLTIRFIR